MKKIVVASAILLAATAFADKSGDAAIWDSKFGRVTPAPGETATITPELMKKVFKMEEKVRRAMAKEEFFRTPITTANPIVRQATSHFAVDPFDGVKIKADLSATGEAAMADYHAFVAYNRAVRVRMMAFLGGGRELMFSFPARVLATIQFYNDGNRRQLIMDCKKYDDMMRSLFGGTRKYLVAQNGAPVTWKAICNECNVEYSEFKYYCRQFDTPKNIQLKPRFPNNLRALTQYNKKLTPKLLREKTKAVVEFRGKQLKELKNALATVAELAKTNPNIQKLYDFDMNMVKNAEKVIDGVVKASTTMQTSDSGVARMRTGKEVFDFILRRCSIPGPKNGNDDGDFDFAFCVERSWNMYISSVQGYLNVTRASNRIKALSK